MESNKQVMTLANSIIGVSVLAMPFCFKECGILLSLLLLVSSSILSRLTCYFLLKSAVLTRRRNYEFLAFHVYGPTGKLAVELFIIGFLLGTCVAFFVVMGDLAPQIISSMMGVKRASGLRTTVMLAMALLVVLPLGLLRNVESLEFICTASIGFYLCLVIKVIAESTPHLLGSDWMHELRLWRPEGVLQSLPIFSMALFCQTQLFEVFGNLPNTPLDKMIEAVRTSINLCTLLYASVGFFGYVAFNSDNLTGNVLMSLEPTTSSEVIKIGFVLSVALSFPLVIFPCRASLYSLVYRNAQLMSHDYSGSHIPDNQFKLLTLSIVIVSLIIGVLLPNIETVLGLVGSTIGVTVCITLPAMLMHVIARQEGDRIISKVTLAMGIIIMVLGTFSHLALIDKAAAVNEKNALVDNLSPLKSLEGASIMESKPSPRTFERESVKLVKPLNKKTDESVVENNNKKASKEDNSKTLQKLEILKEVIQENKQEQEKLLKEQHQILEGLKQHRREAEKLREKLELERSKNATIEYKLKSSYSTPNNKDFEKVPINLEPKKLKVDGLVAKVGEIDPKSAVASLESQRAQIAVKEISKEKLVRTAEKTQVEESEKAKIESQPSLKESAKPVGSQQEALDVKKKVAAVVAASKQPEPAPGPPQPAQPVQSEQEQARPEARPEARSEQDRPEPPLPLPPHPLAKEEKPAETRLANEMKNLGAEAIPLVYKKNSESRHRDKREEPVKCESNDSSNKKKPSSSLLPDLNPLKVHLGEHLQGQMKDSVL